MRIDLLAPPHPLDQARPGVGVAQPLERGDQPRAQRLVLGLGHHPLRLTSLQVDHQVAVTADREDLGPGHREGLQPRRQRVPAAPPEQRAR
ncbi:hypothetical protein EBL85_14565, partial [Marichromatium sp. AB32]